MDTNCEIVDSVKKLSEPAAKLAQMPWHKSIGTLTEQQARELLDLFGLYSALFVVAFDKLNCALSRPRANLLAEAVKLDLGPTRQDLGFAQHRAVSTVNWRMN